MRLNYEESGKGKNVLLLHGNLASKNWWRELLDNPPDVRLIAPTMPGFAGTSTLGKYDRFKIEDYAKFVREFIDDLEIKETKDLRIVGHSLGGAVAMELLVTDSDLFHSAMLIGSCPPEGIKAPVTTYPFINSLKYNKGMLEQLTKQAMPHRQPYNFQQLVDDAKNMNHIAFVGNVIALDNWYLKVHSFERNVYVVGGSDDKLITEDRLINTANKFKYNRLYTLNSGHSPFIENPEEFMKVFDRFIKERRRAC